VVWVHPRTASWSSVGSLESRRERTPSVIGEIIEVNLRATSEEIGFIFVDCHIETSEHRNITHLDGIRGKLTPAVEFLKI
jgi:hypothetical protein